ncbi:MAG: TraB/GumN family protein [Candidatus Binatia bacterium]
MPEGSQPSPRGDAPCAEGRSQPRYPADVAVVTADGREFILLGTAHISRESADLACELIEREQPDCVCLEIDRQRYAALAERQRFEALDLKEIIRRRQLSPLIINLLLASYQRQLGARLGVLPGTEFLEAARAAEARGVPVVLCDRDVRITLRRAWGALSAWRKCMLVGSLIGALFARSEPTEDDLRTLRQQDVVSKLMHELASAFPALKAVLVDERDTYLTEKMRRAEGRRVLAVVGAGHVAGMRQALAEARPADLDRLETIPPVSPLWKWVGWGVPVLILGALAVIGWRKGAAAASDNLLFWTLVNGIPSMVGALLAWGHPATVVTAFAAAPFTSLTPVIGAGYVAAFVQAYCRPPRVHEFQNVTRDVTLPWRWWRNRLLRVFLVFLLTTLGSTAGTLVGGARILANLF